ncbi:3786_t:CDS:2 [Paraglomus brasilianum]|uniref:3786_t:CDS:1 n=1 Tax=Paraglomus brasilianum TaxID=144538 RepID=A0A9N9AHU8_9GLOM|nr:3786_t:CDS:2 [Paraglomus brasilianum]
MLENTITPLTSTFVSVSNPVSPSSPSRRGRKNNSVACIKCRKDKKKCSGDSVTGSPCSYCVTHNEMCIYPSVVRGNGKLPAAELDQLILPRLNQVESQLSNLSNTISAIYQDQQICEQDQQYKQLYDVVFSLLIHPLITPEQTHILRCIWSAFEIDRDHQIFTGGNYHAIFYKLQTCLAHAQQEESNPEIWDDLQKFLDEKLMIDFVLNSDGMGNLPATSAITTNFETTLDFSQTLPSSTCTIPDTKPSSSPKLDKPQQTPPPPITTEMIIEFDNPTQPQQPCTKSKRNRHEKKKSSRSGPYPSSSCSVFPRGGHVVIRKLPKTPYVTDVWSKYDLQDNSPSIFASVKEENNGVSPIATPPTVPSTPLQHTPTVPSTPIHTSPLAFSPLLFTPPTATTSFQIYSPLLYSPPHVVIGDQVMLSREPNEFEFCEGMY